MKNSHCSNFVSWIREPEGYERENLIKRVEMLSGKVLYQKVEGGYKCYCQCCGAMEVMPYKKLKMIRASNKCWNCASDVKTSTKVSGHLHNWVSHDNVDGFWVEYDYSWDKKENIMIDHVIHYEGSKQYVRNCSKFMYAQLYAPEKSWWRLVRTYSDYYYYLADAGHEKVSTLKDYYILEEMVSAFKSNQKTFIMNGVYNHNQMRYIRFFDLNHPEEVERNNKYISKYSGVRLAEKQYKLNCYYLDYLRKEDIPLPEYIDYADYCIQNNEKPQKPKKEAFFRLHDHIRAEIDYQKKKELEPMVKARKDELIGREYSKNNITIKTFDSVYQIILTGKELHDCIGTYCERYANGTTNIYYGEVDNKLSFALEEKNGEIIQVRSDYNGRIDDNVKLFVKEWVKRNNFVWNS